MNSLHKLKVGKGYDVHALGDGRALVIGGVTIPFAQGLLGHSDADVLIHAICDALLGAANLGDIGQHFSPDDPHFAGKDSQFFLVKIARMLAKKGLCIINIDSTIIAQAPKMRNYINEMQSNIAGALSIDSRQVSVKATTTEGLGFVGRGEGIAADAVALICTIKRGS